jgi:hypothetical protein
MDEQEIRAKALEIAVLNHTGRFFNIRNGCIELNERHIAYLKAIQTYIADGTYLKIPDTGCPAFSELT